MCVCFSIEIEIQSKPELRVSVYTISKPEIENIELISTCMIFDVIQSTHTSDKQELK